MRFNRIVTFGRNAALRLSQKSAARCRRAPHPALSRGERGNLRLLKGEGSFCPFPQLRNENLRSLTPLIVNFELAERYLPSPRGEGKGEGTRIALKRPSVELSSSHDIS